MKKMITILGNLLVSTVMMWAQVPGNIAVMFQNTGKMNISNTSGAPVQGHENVTMRVEGSMKISDASPTNQALINFTGGIALQGHFIQDSQGKVFTTVEASGNIFNDGKAANYGFFAFSGTEDQYITMTDSVAFDRSVSYVPFTGIQLATDKQVILTSKMGIDASSIKRKSGNSGSMVLWSNKAGDNVYDASLRITATGSVVDAGSVIVQRYFDSYKAVGSGQSKNSMLFPFATPFNGTQVSGYFAGHWVRRASNDYIYGDKIDPATTNTIARDQYLSDPTEALVPGKAYLVKPRTDADFTQQLIDDNNLLITGGTPSDYIKTKFIMDGKVYSFTPVNESLNTNGVDLGTLSTSTSKIINVVVGNSSTTSIGFDKLVNYLTNECTLPVGRYMYAYVPGATSYIAIDLLAGTAEPATKPASLLQDGDIPAMGTYIVRLAKTAAVQSGNFKVDPKLYSHGTNGHNLRATNFVDEVLFRAVNMNNTFQFDLTAVGLRPNASEKSDNLDMPRMTGIDGGLQLYTLSADLVKLSSNSVPGTTEKVILCAQAMEDNAHYKILAERIESMNSEVLILEDLKTGVKTDLFKTPEYEFLAQKSDDPQRFILHLKTPASTTAIDGVDSQNRKMFYSEGKLNIWGLTAQDKDAKVTVYNMQGQRLVEERVDTYPEFSLRLDLPKGVYIAQISGENNKQVKFSN